MGVWGKCWGSTNVLADVLGQLIAWHGTSTFIGGQCDRSFSEPWPVWFSLCFNWAQGTRGGERTGIWSQDLLMRQWDVLPEWQQQRVWRTVCATNHFPVSFFHQAVWEGMVGSQIITPLYFVCCPTRKSCFVKKWTLCSMCDFRRIK